MPDAAPEKSCPPELHCIAEVRLPIPLELQAEVLRFYTELLGLTPWPPRRQIPGGLGLGDPECGLYLQYRHDPPVDRLRRRFTLIVSGLDALAARLSEYDWPFQRLHGWGLTDQWISLADPVGHLIEIRQSQTL